MKNTKEIYKALGDGETVSNGSIEVYFKENKTLNHYCYFSHPEEWHIKKPDPKPLGRLYRHRDGALRIFQTGKENTHSNWQPVTISENGEVWKAVEE